MPGALKKGEISLKKIHFIDCGANKGQSIAWAIDHYEGKELRIDSFEPQRENFEVLEDRYGDDSRISLHENAVWKLEETKVFYPQTWGARTGSSLIEGKYSTDPRISVEVRCIDLAEWIKENKISDAHTILKIDIEGAEYDVIPHLLANNIQDLVDEWFIEWHGPTKTPNFDPNVEVEFYDTVPGWVDWNSDEVREKMKEIEDRDR